MSDSESYNGWRNVETWRVQLHLANDEGEAAHLLNQARWHINSELYDNYEPVCNWVLNLQGDRWRLATQDDKLSDYVRQYVEYRTARRKPPTSTWGMFRADVVQAALSRVDWEQIAAHWLDAARHELEKGAAT
jgi:hypothetical protein